MSSTGGSSVAAPSDDAKDRRMALTNLNHDAAKATESERNMTLRQGVRLYPKAIGWSILLSMAIVMEGFDTNLITNLVAVPAFKKRFGEQLSSGDYEVTAAWQAGLTNGAYVGEILGLWITGIIADKYGFKKTMMGALALVCALLFIVFFVQSLTQLLVGLILLGMPWGVFQTLTSTYAAEVCPVALRAYLTTYVNLCWVFGQFIASGVLKGVSTRNDEWAYRIPYALQWLWPVPLIIGCALAPESPWWLVRKGRIDEARHTLLRLTSRKHQPDFNADETIAMMKATTEREKSVQEGARYVDCLKHTDLRRTEIACLTWFTQAWCGSAFMGFSTYFYEQAGMDTSNAFSMSLGQYALGAVGVLLSWVLMAHYGRRTLYLYGLVAQCSILLIIGFLGIGPKDNVALQWAIGSMLLLFTFVYDSTVGPVCYSLVTEMPSTRLRQKTVVLARNTYNIANIVSNVLTPRMLNPGAWNWGAKSAFFWAVMCALCAVWTFWRLPEPKGRTYGELDVLFEQRVPARKFKRIVVELGNGRIDAGDEKGKEKRGGSPTVAHVEDVK